MKGGTIVMSYGIGTQITTELRQKYAGDPYIEVFENDKFIGKVGCYDIKELAIKLKEVM
jgi:hypothetical protein